MNAATDSTSFPFTRREFLKSSIAAGVATSLGAATASAVVIESKNGIPYRTLGHTGEKVSMVGLGGYHIGTQLLESDSIKLIRTALDAGINFLDNSWDYHNGGSEVRMGKALKDGYREKAFVMTKIDGRNKAAAARQIDECLQRLQVDHVDLMQFHEIIRDSDPGAIFAPGGAAEAMLDAKKSGKLRYIGFTGHKSPEIHLQMLAAARDHGFLFDSVQMPLNVMDAHFDSFAGKVLPELNKANIGSLGMKPIGGKVILGSKTVTAVECLKYAMNLPASVIITGCDSPEILQQAIDLARNWKPLAKDELAAILAKTAPVASAGQYELYKSTNNFDGTTHNPQWMS